MKKIAFSYGKGTVEYDFENENLAAVLTSGIHDYRCEKDGATLVREAMASPIGSPRLCELAKGKKKVCIIASDHTRPVPSKVIMPSMLEEIRQGNPDADITILIATGFHRGTTRDELVFKFGEDIVNNEKIYVHDCLDEDMLVNIGTLPSGGECVINKIAYEADLLVSEGFIEPHFFAGFSGGRKSVLPGVAAKQTVLANHCSEFIASDKARTGIIEGNPIHRDMIYAAKTAGLCYIVNVVINEKKDAIYAVAGDLEAAHAEGVRFLSGLCGAKAVPSDIVISTNGGYPLDQNVYQAVKGMTAAEATVRDGGVIIMLASSNDGHGGESFFDTFDSEPDTQKIYDSILERDRNETIPDQWESQILCRILLKATVIYVSDAPDSLIKSFHMTPARSLPEALAMAKKLVGENASITAIPDGVSLVIRN